MTAAEDNMKSKLPGSHKSYRERPDGTYVTRLSRAIQVFDSVTAAEDNMKSKLPKTRKTASKVVKRETYQERKTKQTASKGRLENLTMIMKISPQERRTKRR